MHFTFFSGTRRPVQTRRWLVAAAALAATIAQASPAPAGIPVTPEQRFQLALEAQTRHDYRSMLALLQQAAADGQPEAQEMLAFVLIGGPSLYGAAVKADRCAARHWMLQAAAQGSETAKVQLHFLNRIRNAPSGKAACATAVKG
jgi:TPR repeat protein